MNQKKELKILNQIEAICTNTNDELKKIQYFVRTFKIFGLFTIFLSIVLINKQIISAFLGVVISAIGGIAVGLAIYGEMALTQWPLLKSCIDANILKKKINEVKKT